MRLLYSSVVALALSLGAAPVFAEPAADPAKPAIAGAARASDGAAPARRAPGTSEDIARYSERQAASPQAKQYEGGDTIVIGATTATVVLAVVLLIVLR